MDNQNNIPQHIGIIMDGNGRWAAARGKKRSYGHIHGSANVDRIVTYAFSKGVKVLSLYAFSTENRGRPKQEVDKLFSLLKEYLKKYIRKLLTENVKLEVMGDVDELPPSLRTVIAEDVAKTADNKGFVLNIAINYGGRQEIVAAANKLKNQNKDITVASLTESLYTSDLPDPDLIIRTGGEIRLSNFMLFQSAYSELYFTDVLWPDFDEKQFDAALENFALRRRRYGKI